MFIVTYPELEAYAAKIEQEELEGMEEEEAGTAEETPHQDAEDDQEKLHTKVTLSIEKC